MSDYLKLSRYGKGGLQAQIGILMGTKKPQRNVQQHFVTASYLGGFTPDGDRNSQLYVYERKTEKVFRTIPDKAAKRRNYYSIPKPGGEFDDRIDEMLTKLEEQAMPSLRKLLTRDYDLSMAEARFGAEIEAHVRQLAA